MILTGIPPSVKAAHQLSQSLPVTSPPAMTSQILQSQITKDTILPTQYFNIIITLPADLESALI